MDPEPKTNGQPAKVPEIKIGWDAEHQSIGLSFDTKEFKTWEFVLAVLKMAERRAEQEAEVARMQMMLHKQHTAMEAQAIRQKLTIH